MVAEKKLQIREDSDCLKFHIKMWLNHVKTVERNHRYGNNVGFGTEESAIVKPEIIHTLII
jgi:hypothetical protein